MGGDRSARRRGDARADDRHRDRRRRARPHRDDGARCAGLPALPACRRGARRGGRGPGAAALARGPRRRGGEPALGGARRSGRPLPAHRGARRLPRRRRRPRARVLPDRAAARAWGALTRRRAARDRGVRRPRRRGNRRARPRDRPAGGGTRRRSAGARARRAAGVALGRPRGARGRALALGNAAMSPRQRTVMAGLAALSPWSLAFLFGGGTGWVASACSATATWSSSVSGSPRAWPRAPATRAGARTTWNRWRGTCGAATSTRLWRVRRDLLHEAIKEGPGVLRKEHRRNPDHADAGGGEPAQLVADLADGADERGVLGERLGHAEALRERGPQAVGLGAVVADQQRHVGRAGDGFRVAPGGAAVSVEDGALARERLGPAPDVPVIGVTRGDLERDLLAAAADHQLGVRTLHGLRRERRVAELVVAPLEGDLVLRPQRLEHLAGLVEAREALGHRVEGKAVRLVLVLLPRGADAADEAAARDDVHLRGHLREHRGVPVGVA